MAARGGARGWPVRAEAIWAEGAVAACQLVHPGRETPEAETWFHPVAPVVGSYSPERAPAASTYWVIGDAVVPRRAAHAIAEGRAVAQHICAHAARAAVPAQA